MSQKHQWTRDQLKDLSAEQLNLFLHEVKWILDQLGKVIPGEERPVPEVYRHASKLVEQVAEAQEALILERAHRQFSFLQAEILSCAKDRDLQMTPALYDLLDSTNGAKSNDPII